MIVESERKRAEPIVESELSERHLLARCYPDGRYFPGVISRGTVNRCGPGVNWTHVLVKFDGFVRAARSVDVRASRVKVARARVVVTSITVRVAQILNGRGPAVSNCDAELYHKILYLIIMFCQQYIFYKLTLWSRVLKPSARPGKICDQNGLAWKKLRPKI